MFKILKEKLKNLIRKKEEHIEEEEEKIKGKISKEKRDVIKKKDIETDKGKDNKKIEIAKGSEKKKEEIKNGEEEKKKKTKGEESIFKKFQIGKIKITEGRFYDFFEDLRLILWQNNVANEVVDYIEERLKKKIIGEEVKKNEFDKFMENKIKEVIKETFIDSLPLITIIKDSIKEKRPFVIVFFGINGSGKTTTIAKIAYLLKQENISSVFAASDTFRAASIEQLEKHGKNLGIRVIKHRYGSDPAAVAFDAIKYAKSHNIDVVLIDTSGRMHTDRNLLEEMKKICRVNNPDLKIFVAEAIVGNDAIEQAKAFNDEIGIDGIILSKADIDEKGGAALSISYVTKKPIFFLGIGQSYDEIEIFDKEKVLARIFE